MQDKSYWITIARSRATRRRMLGTSVSGLAGTALLAACGGGDDGGDASTPRDTSGLVTDVKDTDKVAKRGGVFKFSLATDIPRGLDPYIREVTARPHIVRSYQTLWRPKPGVNEQAQEEVQEALQAESWEVSQDKLQLTVKLRQDSHFDPRPPTSGRAVEAKDVAFSWSRYAQIATLRSDLANSVNAGAPILSMTATDSRTVVIKLAFPAADVISQLGSQTAGYFFIMPTEADGGFDIRREQRGSGPWYMSEYVPSSRFVFSRNPGYWDKVHPFVDGWDIPIISEYAQVLAQLRQGSIYASGTAVRADDVVPLKRDVADMQLSTTFPGASANEVTFFGWQDGAKSPFRDVRVRQAYALAQDRKLWIDTFWNVPKFRGEGLPMDVQWNSTAVPSNRTGWWLDPQGKDFGENAKYYKYDVAEAKKLLAAAGYNDGFDFDAHYVSTGQVGDPKHFEVLMGMVQEAGIRAKLVPSDYATEWRPKFSDVKGNFDGLAFRLASTDTARSNLAAVYNKAGSLFFGFAADGKSGFSGDPKYDELTDKMNKEFDANAAYALAHELQRLDAKNQYVPKVPGSASGFQISWPVLSNYAAYTADPSFLHTWIDETQAPIKKA